MDTCNSGIPCRFHHINTSSLVPQLYERSNDYDELVRELLVHGQAYGAALPVMSETTVTRPDLDFTTPLFFMEGGLLVRACHRRPQWRIVPRMLRCSRI